MYHNPVSIGHWRMDILLFYLQKHGIIFLLNIIYRNQGLYKKLLKSNFLKISGYNLIYLINIILKPTLFWTPLKFTLPMFKKIKGHFNAFGALLHVCWSQDSQFSFWLYSPSEEVRWKLKCLTKSTLRPLICRFASFN